MHFKTSVNYGLRLVIYLAIKGCVCPSRDIAKAIDVPRDYLVQIAQLLRKGGTIEALTGKNGGYRLAKDPSEITLYDIVSLLEDDRLTPEQIERKAAERERQTPVTQSVLDVLDSVSDDHDEYLGGITLQTVVDNARESRGMDSYLKGNAGE